MDTNNIKRKSFNATLITVFVLIGAILCGLGAFVFVTMVIVILLLLWIIAAIFIYRFWEWIWSKRWKNTFSEIKTAISKFKKEIKKERFPD